MAQQLHTTATTDLGFIMILFILSYVLSSAPRYVREAGKTEGIIKTERSVSTSKLIKVGKYYAVDPYVKAWKLMKKSFVPGSAATPESEISTSVAQGK